MPVAEEQVSITLTLPRSVVERVRKSAEKSHRSVEQEATVLLQTGISKGAALRESLERARSAYDAEIKRAGKSRPTTEELWEQMRRIREEVANGFYPG